MPSFSTDRDWLLQIGFLRCSLSRDVPGQGMISNMTSHPESDLKHAAGVHHTLRSRLRPVDRRWTEGGQKLEDDQRLSSHSSSSKPSLLGLGTGSIEKLSTVTGRGEAGCFKLGSTCQSSSLPSGTCGPRLGDQTTWGLFS